jgi:hypothetical protein
MQVLTTAPSPLSPQVRALLAEMEQQVSPVHASAHHGAARMHVLTTTPPPSSPQVTHAEEDELQRRRLQAISASETERNRRLEEMHQTAAEEEAR